jgi:tetratricopeptide (TPR) repeat protein
MRRALCASFFVVTFGFTSRVTYAQTAPSAETLFQEARVLVENGNYAEACPKLEESQKLDPAVGTQFNLADCYEHVGRTATAYALFKEVAAIARAAGKFEREKNAKERAGVLEPKLARVRLVVAGAAPGLEVKIDDQTIARARWAEAFPIDPGAHRIIATAPEHETFEARFAAKDGTSADVQVPELVDLRPKSPIIGEAPGEPTRKPSVLTYVAGGIGVAALATGAITGVIAISKHSDAESACPKDRFAFRCPTQAGTDAWNDATTVGNVSTIAFVVAGVALAGAALLYFTTPKTTKQSAASLLLEGRF